MIVYGIAAVFGGRFHGSWPLGLLIVLLAAWLIKWYYWRFIDGQKVELDDGAVVIASITSCTNTSNPGVMLGAGLVAKKAVEKGLKVKPWVKTSLAPGSKVVTEDLQDAGLMH